MRARGARRLFRTVAVALVASSASLILPALPAYAGGTVFAFDRRYYVPGDVATAARELADRVGELTKRVSATEGRPAAIRHEGEGTADGLLAWLVAGALAMLSVALLVLGRRRRPGPPTLRDGSVHPDFQRAAR